MSVAFDPDAEPATPLDPTPPDNAAADTPAPKPALAFDAVPVAPRSHGWTAYRQRLFIAALAETGCVEEAAEAAGVTSRSAYRLRLRAGAESFAAAWERAQALGVQRLTAIAFERAITGRKRGIWHKGELVGHEWVPSNRLLIYLLQHFDQSRYGNLSGIIPCKVPNPLDKAKAELPAHVARLNDQPVPPHADVHESMDVLWQEE